MAKDKDSFTPGTDDLPIDMGEIQPAAEPKKKSLYDTSNPYEKYKNYKDPVAARYRKKMLANFFISTSIIIVILFSVVAYVTSIVSDYTIQLARGANDLSLCETPLFEPGKATTRLAGEALDSSYCLDASLLPDGKVLDRDNDGDQNVAIHNGAVKNQGAYVGYTFYMKNVSYSETNVDYKYTIAITDSRTGTQGVGLDDVVRYRLYRNDVKFADDGVTLLPASSQDHESVTYAKANKNPVNVYDDEGNVTGQTYAEALFGDRTSTKPKEYCTNFASDTCVVENQEATLKYGSVVRFTIVVWIEGNDSDCQGNIPDGASIQFAFTIGLKKSEESSSSSESSNPESSAINPQFAIRKEVDFENKSIARN